MIALEGPRFAPRAGGAPDCLVVLIHGYGANGGDLIQLAPHLSRALPSAQFVAPDAPQPVPGYPQGRQWYPIARLDPAAMEEGARRAAPTLDRFLDLELARYRLAPERLALVGFSQGAMMTLFVGPRRPASPFGLVAFSGALIAGRALAEEKRCSPPIVLVHGTEDQVVPAGLTLEAARGLADAGLWALWRLEAGLPHAIGPAGLELASDCLARWRAERLAPARPKA